MQIVWLAIKLGNFSLRSVTPWSEVGWFLIGVFLLVGLSFFVVWWNRRNNPDPFI